MNRARQPLVARVCATCGATVLVNRYRAGRERVFCNRACFAQRPITEADRHKGARRNYGAPAWKVSMFANMSEAELVAYCTAMLTAYAEGRPWPPHHIEAQMHTRSSS